MEGFGIRSVAPAGWTRVDDEYWISPDQSIELVIKEEIGTDEEALLDRWGATGEWRDVEANGRQWRVYDVVDRDDLGRYHGYIGTSPGDEGFYMVLMIGATRSRCLICTSSSLPRSSVRSSWWTCDGQ